VCCVLSKIQYNDVLSIAAISKRADVQPVARSETVAMGLLQGLVETDADCCGDFGIAGPRFTP